MTFIERAKTFLFSAPVALTLIALALLLLDVPFASWIDRYLKINAPVIKHSDLPDLLLLAVVILTAFCWIGYFYLTRLNIYDQRTFFCRVTGITLPFSFGIKIILKWFFGRTDTRIWLSDPSLYSFHWFAGSDGFEGFPSGHMLGLSPLFMALWQLYPRYRLFCGSLWFGLGSALIITEYHFLSDVLAGAYVGATIYLFISKELGKLSN